jgi:hypothetical protein
LIAQVFETDRCRTGWALQQWTVCAQQKVHFLFRSQHLKCDWITPKKEKAA